MINKGDFDRCAVCGYGITEKHRIIPGKDSGKYTRWNVMFLCANHHQAIHFLISFDRRLGSETHQDITDEDMRKWSVYMQDTALMAIWMELVNIRSLVSDDHYADALVAMDETNPGAYDATPN